MNLKKWATNSPTLQNMWLKENINCKQATKELGIPLKVLGIIWNNVKYHKCCHGAFQSHRCQSFYKNNCTKGLRNVIRFFGHSFLIYNWYKAAYTTTLRNRNFLGWTSQTRISSYIPEEAWRRHEIPRHDYSSTIFQGF